MINIISVKKGTISTNLKKRTMFFISVYVVIFYLEYYKNKMIIKVEKYFLLLKLLRILKIIFLTIYAVVPKTIFT